MPRARVTKTTTMIKLATTMPPRPLSAPLSAVEERERRALAHDHAFLDPLPKVSYERLAPGAELALIRRTQVGDPHAGRALLALHGRFIVALTQRMSRRLHDRADLYQEARLGFLRAATQFDPANGAKLTTYAAPKVRNRVTRWRSNHGTDIYVPLHIRDAMKKIRALGPDTPEGRAHAKKVPAAAEVLGIDYGAESFDALPTGIHGLAETLAAEAPSPEEQVADVDRRAWLSKVIASLLSRMSARSRRVILLRYLEGWSCAEVAAELGCCTMNVYQAEKKALRWMRGQLTRLRGVTLDDLPERYTRAPACEASV